MPFDYLEHSKSHWQERLQKSYFINNYIDKMANIFINHRECVNCKLVSKL